MKEKSLTLTKRCVRLAAAVAALVALFAFPSVSRAQTGKSVPQPSRSAGRFYAAEYGKWTAHTQNITAAGASSVVSQEGLVTLNSGTGGGADSRLFNVFQNSFPYGGTYISVLIDNGAPQETVTLTGTSGCTQPQNQSSSGSACTLSGTFANAHGQNVQIRSGTYGLQEALNDAAASGGGVVVLDQGWGGTNTMITSSVYPSSVTIEDDRGVLPMVDYYSWRPSAVTQIAAPTAPTLTKVSGSLSAGTYYVSAEYVDALGGISLPSTSNNDVTTATGVSVASPAASTGAVGWIPLITAASGADGTEIVAAEPLTSSICTLSVLVSTTPACAIGSAATITTAPSGTSGEVVESTAFSTYAPQPFAILPPPFENVYPIGVFVVGSTLNSGATASEDLAQFQTDAQYMNGMGRALRVCVKVATATQVSSSVLVIKLETKQHYAQTPVVVSTITFATQTMAAAGTVSGCWDVSTVATGSSGTLFATSDGLWTNVLNSTPSETTKSSTDVTTAASSAVDLTKELFWSVNASETVGDNITGPIITLLTILPIQ